MRDLPYRGMDRAALDAAYNNGAAIADSARIMEGWKERSAAVRAGQGARLDLEYGARPREKFDFFPADNDNPPLFVFIHGGYWQVRERETFACFASGPRAQGFAVAVPGYTLAPDVSLRVIVEEIRRALTRIAGKADELGFDATRIFAGGWSAGAHLTAMMLDHPAVKGGLAISGIFDLEPIALTYVNDALRLSESEIADLSPIRLLRSGLARARICVGGDELPELRRQSSDYAAAAKTAGLDMPLKELEGRNHFTILEELENPSGLLTQELAALARGK